MTGNKSVGSCGFESLLCLAAHPPKYHGLNVNPHKFSPRTAKTPRGKQSFEAELPLHRPRTSRPPSPYSYLSERDPAPLSLIKNQTHTLPPGHPQPTKTPQRRSTSAQ
ncbi:hypothetical protein CGRA01v4_03010 [Colletotrichum graminicola]|nr:hypothetical protein CGRA01v4_03010 [Colletotrichum graminicola]